jgi:hypothetical protein
MILQSERLIQDEMPSIRRDTSSSLVHAAVQQVENNLRFQGQYYDEKSGLHYNLYR